MRQIEVTTTHRVTSWDEDCDESHGALIDSDNTARLVFAETFDFEGKKVTRWMNRKELLRLRRVIDAVLRIIP